MKKAEFYLESDYQPMGDQPTAIAELVQGVQDGKKSQVLLGVTGSGKTFTMANVIAQLGRPALIMAPNKILAAQLYTEMKAFFPRNHVEYFVSYYDYYHCQNNQRNGAYCTPKYFAFMSRFQSHDFMPPTCILIIMNYTGGC